MGFGCISFGNQYFSMTGKDMELNKLNEETLYLLARKTKKIILNRIYKTQEVLRRLVANPTAYSNIEALSVEFHKDYISLYRQINKLTNITDLSLF